MYLDRIKKMFDFGYETGYNSGVNLVNRLTKNELVFELYGDAEWD